MVRNEGIHRIQESTEEEEMTLDDLYNCISSDIEVCYFLFEHTESLSAPIGDGFVIAIDPTKIRSEADEKEKVAHEVGHCETGSFYSPGEDHSIRQRYENRADKWAIKKLVPEDELKEAVSEGNTELWQLAEYFGVSESFMLKAVCLYKNGNFCDLNYYAA